MSSKLKQKKILIYSATTKDLRFFLGIVDSLNVLSAEEDSFYKENATDKEKKENLKTHSLTLRLMSTRIIHFVQSTEDNLNTSINGYLAENIYDLNRKMKTSALEDSANYFLNYLNNYPEYKVGDCEIPGFSYKAHLLYELIHALYCKAEYCEEYHLGTKSEKTESEIPSQTLNTAAFTMFAKLLSAELELMLSETVSTKKDLRLSKLRTMLAEIEKEEIKSVSVETLLDIFDLLEDLLAEADVNKNHPNLFKEFLPETSLEALNIEEYRKETEQKQEVA